MSDGEGWIVVHGFAAGGCAFAQDGSLWLWGNNASGQLGDGTTNSQSGPVRIGAGVRWKSVATAWQSSYGIQEDGTLWGWGATPVWDPATSPAQSVAHATPERIGTDTNCVSVSEGLGHAVGLKRDGSLWLWGPNAEIFGLASEVARTQAPVRVGKDNNWREVVPGGCTFFARKADGSWWAAGRNSRRDLGLPRADCYPEPVRLKNGDNWTTVAGHYTGGSALACDGSLWAWGTALGAPDVKPANVRRRDFVNELCLKVHLRPYYEEPTWEPRYLRPTNLWSLPPEVVSRLTNAPNAQPSP